MIPTIEIGVIASSIQTPFTGPSLPLDTVYSYTGSDQDYTIPSGVTKIQYAIGGGAGGGSDYSGGRTSGAGGYVTGEFDVSPGDILRIQVGQGGRGAPSTSEGGASAWPDSGPGGRGDVRCASGGGSTRIWLSEDSGSTWALKAIAGGGGACGSYITDGGAGGGTSGQDGSGGSGTGGTQSTGGYDVTDSGNTNKTGVAVSLTDPTPAQTGGWGSSTGDTTTSTTDDGAGGGGGYYGGGGGGGDAQSGGGGSSWFDPLTTGLTYAGNWNAVASEMSSLSDYPSGASAGHSGSGGLNDHGANGFAAIYHS